MDDKTMKLAQRTYGTLKQAITDRGWTCQANDEEMSVDFGVTGDDVKMLFSLVVDADLQLVLLYSPLPFNMSEESITMGAVALCYINNRLPDGNFDLDLGTGRICFRQSLTFRESIIGPQAFQYMLDCATYIVDEFNDKLLMLSKGAISFEDFMASME